MALAAVGWADGQLSSDEADAIVRAACDEGLDLAEIGAIEEATKKPLDVGAIDISKMSKADRLFVYAVGTWIVNIDGAVAAAEKAALDRLGQALRIPARPREIVHEITAAIGRLSHGDEPAFYNLPKLRTTLKIRLAEAAGLRAAAKSAEAPASVAPKAVRARSAEDPPGRRTEKMAAATVSKKPAAKPKAGAGAKKGSGKRP